MNAFIPALLVVLIAETGGKTQALAHGYGMVRQMPRGLSALFTTSLIAYAVAAVAGMLIGQILPMEARNLMFGVALLAAGLPMVTKAKPSQPPPIGGSAARSLFAFARTQMGDAAQFLVFALAVQGGSPTLAIMGALAGIMMAAFLPMALRNDWPQGRTLHSARWGGALILSVAGFVVAINALGLVNR